jgi:hypothetical protein
MFRLFNFKLFFDAPDAGSGGGPDIFGKQDIFDALSDDKDEKIDLDIDDKPADKDDKSDDKSDKDDKDDKKPEKKDKKADKDKDDSKEEDVDDIEELEKELAEDEEPDEEKLDLVTPVRRKEILKKYPKLFEDFPYLERAYYREQQFTEVFPTIDAAKSAVESVQALEGFEADLAAGNTEKMLLAAKQGNPRGFNKLVDNYLTTLQKVDEKSYTHVIGNVFSHAIYEMVQEANRSGKTELKNLAQGLNEYIFGTSKYVAPKQLEVEEKEDPRVLELQEEKKQFLQERFNVASSELRTKVGNLFKSTISQHIDPKNTMPPYVKQNAEREAYEFVNELLVSDQRFRTIVDTLWAKAAKKNFSSDAMQELRKAFLGRGKSLLPTAIKKARLKALSGMRPTTSAKDTDKDDTDDKPEKATSRNTDKSRSTGKSDKYRGMSTLDALMSED